MILFHFATSVKPVPTFGRGILASRPVHKAPYTASEAQWWAQESARLSDARENAHYDFMYAESAATDLLGRGIGYC